MNEELLDLLEREVLAWPGVTKEAAAGGAGRGGFWVPPFTSYRFGRKELGHVHDTGVADLPFPKAVYDELVATGRAEPHAAGFSGVVSYSIREREDVAAAVELFRLNYDRARASAEQRRKSRSDHPAP